MATTITAGNATNGAAISSDNTGILELKTGTGAGTTAMTVNTSQNVGIGTSSPALPIDVVSNSSALALSIRGRSSDDIGTLMYYTNNGVTNTAQIQMRPNDNEFRFAALGARSQTFYTNGSERARITSVGNLLLGVTSDSGLTAGGDFALKNGASIRFRNAADSAYLNMINVDSSNNLNFGVGGVPATITFGISGVGEAARFSSGGQFLLGATALTSNGFFTNAGTSAALTSASGTNVRAWAQTYRASASNNATVDAWLGLDAAGNVFGNGPMIGHFFVNVVGASGVNQFSGVYSIVTTSNGTIAATLAAVSTVTRGTSPVASIQIANNGASGAIKLTITYINNSGVVTGGASTVTFIGQIS